MGAPPNWKSDHFGIETHGDKGVSHFNKPAYTIPIHNQGFGHGSPCPFLAPFDPPPPQPLVSWESSLSSGLFSEVRSWRSTSPNRSSPYHHGSRSPGWWLRLTNHDGSSSHFYGGKCQAKTLKKPLKTSQVTGEFARRRTPFTKVPLQEPRSTSWGSLPKVLMLSVSELLGRGFAKAWYPKSS